MGLWGVKGEKARRRGEVGCGKSKSFGEESADEVGARKMGVGYKIWGRGRALEGEMESKADGWESKG